MSVTLPAGFRAGGMAIGIKDGTVPDLAMVATEDGRPVSAAGVFTSHLAAAAPVPTEISIIFVSPTGQFNRYCGSVAIRNSWNDGSL